MRTERTAADPDVSADIRGRAEVHPVTPSQRLPRRHAARRTVTTRAVVIVLEVRAAVLLAWFSYRRIQAGNRDRVAMAGALSVVEVSQHLRGENQPEVMFRHPRNRGISALALENYALTGEGRPPPHGLFVRVDHWDLQVLWVVYSRPAVRGDVRALLETHLGGQLAFRPILVNNQQYWFVVFPVIDALDMERSSFDYLRSGAVKRPNRYVWNSNRLPEVAMFTVPTRGLRRRLYATSAMAQICVDAGIVGLTTFLPAGEVV